MHGALASDDDDGAGSIGAVPVACRGAEPNPSFDQLARECDCQLISRFRGPAAGAVGHGGCDVGHDTVYIKNATKRYKIAPASTGLRRGDLGPD